MNGNVSLLVLAAYLLGSVPFGLLAGKLKGVDIRKHGSGNIGATNAFRVCGKGLGTAVFILDVLKGLLPVLLAIHLDGNLATDGLAPILAGVAAIAGHNFPVWLKFKGGKGIATSAGVLAGILPWALLVGLLVWASAFAITRYVSVASILAALSLPVTVGVSTLQTNTSFSDPEFLFASVIGILAVWRHRINIQRLREGTEHRFTKKGGPEK